MKLTFYFSDKNRSLYNLVEYKDGQRPIYNDISPIFLCTSL